MESNKKPELKKDWKDFSKHLISLLGKVNEKISKKQELKDDLSFKNFSSVLQILIATKFKVGNIDFEHQIVNNKLDYSFGERKSGGKFEKNSLSTAFGQELLGLIYDSNIQELASFLKKEVGPSAAEVQKPIIDKLKKLH